MFTTQIRIGGTFLRLVGLGLGLTPKSRPETDLIMDDLYFELYFIVFLLSKYYKVTHFLAFYNCIFQMDIWIQGNKDLKELLLSVFLNSNYMQS